jgi:cytochrome b561
VEWFKASLAALPLLLVAIWMVAGVFGARLAARPGSARWSLPSKSFHWVMAFATLGTTALMYYSQIYEAQAEVSQAARERYRELLWVHKSLGLLVLFLVLFRFAWNRHQPRPPLPDGLAPAQQRLATTAHHSLYLLMLLIPPLGWFASMAYGGRTDFFGLFEMPVIVAKDYDAAVIYRNGHIWLGWLMFALLLLHIGAALWHHFLRRDATLAQMLPWGRRNGAAS